MANKKTPKKASKKSPSKKAPVMSKADFVRSMGSASASAIAEAAKKKGLGVISEAYVYNVRATDKQKKPAKKAAAKKAPAAKSNDDEQTLRDLIFRLGHDRVQAIVDDVRKQMLG